MQRIKSFIKLIFLLIFLISMIAGSLFVSSFQDSPIVSKHRPLNPEQFKQLKEFIKANDPSRFKAGETQTAAITESEINFFVGHSLDRFDDKLRAKIRLFKNSIYITSSFLLPNNPIGDYLNISAQLIKKNSEIDINSLQVGNISVPDFMATIILKLAHDELSLRFTEYKYAIKSVTDFNLNKGLVSVHYVWNTRLANQIQNSIATQVMPIELRRRISAYSNMLSIVSRSITETKPSLSTLMHHMFTFAIDRSKTNNPVEENRALLITLGAHMLGKNIPKLLGDQSADPIPSRSYYLHERNDLSKHFLISSALTAMANPTIAQTIGLNKEIDDSAGGSGFSFADLAADRAGVSMANIALSSKVRARNLQLLLSQIQNESDFMPGIDSLQEGMQDIDFKQAFKHTDSAEYNMVIDIIDHRIAQCELHQL